MNLGHSSASLKFKMFRLEVIFAFGFHLILDVIIRLRTLPLVIERFLIVSISDHYTYARQNSISKCVLLIGTRTSSSTLLRHLLDRRY